MLFSEATGRTVLSTGTAETVGTVAGFLVDPATAQIVAVRLKKTHGSGDTVHWPDLTSFGADNVTVTSADVITQANGTAKDLDSKAPNCSANGCSLTAAPASAPSTTSTSTPPAVP